MKEYLKGIASSTSYPEAGLAITSGLTSYIKAYGTPTGSTISYTLGPCSGAGWDLLVSKASSSGVAEYIVSDWLVTEYAGSTKVVPSSTGPKTVPMSFNSAVVVPNMSHLDNYDQAWDQISRAIIDFFSPEIV